MLTNIRPKNVNPHTQFQQFPGAGGVPIIGEGVGGVQRGVFVGISDCLTLRVLYEKEVLGEVAVTRFCCFSGGAVKGGKGGPQNVKITFFFFIKTKDM